jgi:hypothetical protein
MRVLGIFAGLLAIAGYLCLAQAQTTIPLAGAGKSAPGGASAVVFDNLGFSNNSGSGTSFTWVNGANWVTNPNVGSGGSTSNLALGAGLFFCGANSGTSSAPSMTWNGVSMSLISGPFANSPSGDIFFFGLTAPATGTKNIAASWTGTNVAGVATFSVSNANQTGGTTTFHGSVSNTGASTNNTVTVSAFTTGEAVFAGYMSATNYSTTQGNSDIGHNNVCSISTWAANYSTSTNVMSYTNTGSGKWVAAGLSIKAK